MQIVCLSDPHELHRDVDVPDGDLLIHAGDITFFSQRRSVLGDFNDWLGELPHPHKVVIPGNHDSLLEIQANRDLITNAHLLINAGVVLEGLKIWGSPAMPLADCAFGTPDDTARAEIWSRIPTDTDILVTHVPPFRILDGEPNGEYNGGCQSLREAYRRIRPRLHVFGHVHTGFGIAQARYTKFVNAALPGEFGDLEHEPIVSVY